MFLIDIVITCFIKYEFKLNWMNVYICYDVVLMFMNDMKWWLRHGILRKEDTILGVFGGLINKEVYIEIIKYYRVVRVK